MVWKLGQGQNPDFWKFGWYGARGQVRCHQTRRLYFFHGYTHRCGFELNAYVAHWLGLDARKNLDQETRLFERSEFAHFPKF